jgi:hypothetical protein
MCFGVRDRRTGHWHNIHWALNQRLATAFPDAHGKLCRFGVPVMGEPLCFMVEGRPQYTSAVLAVEEREHLDLSGGFRRDVSKAHEEIARRAAGSIRETF